MCLKVTLRGFLMISQKITSRPTLIHQTTVVIRVFLEMTEWYWKSKVYRVKKNDGSTVCCVASVLLLRHTTLQCHNLCSVCHVVIKVIQELKNMILSVLPALSRWENGLVEASRWCIINTNLRKRSKLSWKFCWVPEQGRMFSTVMQLSDLD